MLCDKIDKGTLLIVETDNSNQELKSVLNIDTQLPNVESISWCCTNGILFGYADKLYSVGCTSDGSELNIPIHVGNIKDNEGISYKLESDGLRVLTSNGIYFLQEITDHELEAFQSDRLLELYK